MLSRTGEKCFSADSATDCYEISEEVFTALDTVLVIRVEDIPVVVDIVVTVIDVTQLIQSFIYEVGLPIGKGHSREHSWPLCFNYFMHLLVFHIDHLLE